jgi:hypothetical protein
MNTVYKLELGQDGNENSKSKPATKKITVDAINKISTTN